jgi:hypothetical protein
LRFVAVAIASFDTAGETKAIASKVRAFRATGPVVISALVPRMRESRLA